MVLLFEFKLVLPVLNLVISEFESFGPMFKCLYFWGLESILILALKSYSVKFCVEVGRLFQILDMSQLVSSVLWA